MRIKSFQCILLIACALVVCILFIVLGLISNVQHDGYVNKTVAVKRELHWSGDVNELDCFGDELKLLLENGVVVRQPSRAELFDDLRTRCEHGEQFKMEKCNMIGLLTGPVRVQKTEVTLEYIYEYELDHVRYGGWWRPKNCTANQKTAIIIPIRNRANQLPVLLRHLIPVLTRHKLHFRIFVIEQDDRFGFNRAKLFNIGFREAKSFYPFTCFVFHDVDLIPENDRIDYSCKQSPKHLAAGVSTFNYRLFSEKLFGGVVAFTPEHFRVINGFSNLFYVWGGEDDVLYERVLLNKLKPNREDLKIGRYTMLSHQNREKVRTKEEYLQMMESMKLAMKYAHEDGLKTLQYRVNEYREHKLYTNIKVDLQKSLDKKFVLQGRK